MSLILNSAAAAGGSFHLPRPELTAVRVFPVQIQRAAGLLDLIQTEGLPSDRALAHAFRAERSMGKRDRTQLQVLVFYVLRHWRALDWLLDLPAGLPSSALVEAGGVSLRGRIADERMRDAVESLARSRFNHVDSALRTDETVPEGWTLRVIAALEALQVQLSAHVFGKDVRLGLAGA